MLILRGSGLSGVEMVSFVASVGGFAGQLVVDVAPISVLAGEIHVVVPTVNAFVGPMAVPPSSPFGTITTDKGGGDLDFFFMEETMGGVSNVGTGTTSSSGRKPVISFDLSTGEPVSGNLGWVVKLVNAPPNEMVTFAVARPAEPPFLMLGDGTVVLDLNQIILLQPGLMTDGMGNAQLNLPIPNVAMANVNLQWAVTDFGNLLVSNGMNLML